MFQINVSGPEMNPGEIPNPPEHNKKVHLQSFSCTLYTTFNTVTLYTCLLLSTGQYS